MVVEVGVSSPKTMNIPLDRLISVEPTRIIGSFDRRGEEAMVHTR
ncbi:hypothetical protein GTCCBUS3UF5_21320 [Geobacillus thermoleovorans CCB_US3_UF5]|uniref:Uncharacterized protein n=1 Tax=Geobacillus thermoleovorans CCB_US3_UF5 TaxID=1111068 RepID=A0ABM5MI93_GEOTH|nr:hypothetical protein GTCCBUS3UF5_21320 [Geobacillus thermoleovorans CCB_US3_UF5]GAJ58803.1 hypothetical protein B23_2015 [Geobacillus thermoleovorans B23]